MPLVEAHCLRYWLDDKIQSRKAGLKTKVIHITKSFTRNLHFNEQYLLGQHAGSRCIAAKVEQVSTSFQIILHFLPELSALALPLNQCMVVTTKISQHKYFIKIYPKLLLTEMSLQIF